MDTYSLKILQIFLEYLIILINVTSGVVLLLSLGFLTYYVTKKNLWCFKRPSKTFNRRSLPPLPGHVYEELRPHLNIRKMDQVQNQIENEGRNDGYLVPIAMEENEYFEPTLNQFQIINARNVPQIYEDPDIIPMISYESNGLKKTQREDESKLKVVRFEARDIGDF